MIKSWIKSHEMFFLILLDIIVLDLMIYIKTQDWLALSNLFIIGLYLFENYDHYKFKNLLAMEEFQDSMKDLEKTLNDLFNFDKKDNDKKD